MKCWNCGAQNLKTNKVCKKCGSELTGPEPEAKTEPVTESQQRRVKTWLWILLGAAGLVLLFGLILVLINIAPANSKGASRQAAAAIDATQTVAGGEQPQVADDGTDQQDTDLPASMPAAAQGEGCDWNTCAWMEQEQCETCGGTWADYGDEAYCDCSAQKWQSQELEWCKFEGGSWLEDEGRCTFLDVPNAEAQTEFVSACSDLYYNNQSGDEAGYQDFKAQCKQAGGVDQCWDETCDLSVCLCPNAENVPLSCNWVSGLAVNSNIKCYDENGTCWLTIDPSGAIGNLKTGEGQPQVVVKTSDGQIYSSVDLTRDNSGCLYDADQISCLIAENGTFNTTLVNETYLCMDLCCLDLDNLVSGNVVVQSGNCPGGGNLEVWDFQLVKGVLTLEIRNSMGWNVNTLEVFLDDAKGDPWSTLSCKIDDKYDTIMNCEGWAVYKSGYATMSFYYGTGSNACSVSNVKFSIPEMSRCNYNQTYCAYNDACCSSGYSCCSCGCKKLGDGESCSDVCD
ncbi:MAG: hypothetical protein PWQ55_2152 [Chloroflexota bacterium]|nr:hypothetical protein [Chloroflexota bacterium]